jgi:TonB family protein
VVYPVDEPPASLRGTQVVVSFWVDARGRVTKVEITSDVGDASYRRKLLDSFSQWIFYPARRADGTRVEGQIKITHSL